MHTRLTFVFFCLSQAPYHFFLPLLQPHSLCPCVCVSETLSLCRVYCMFHPIDCFLRKQKDRAQYFYKGSLPQSKSQEKWAKAIVNVSVAWVNNIRNVFTESRLQFTYSVAYSLHFVINKRLLAARSKGKREQNAHTLAFNFAFDEEEFSKHCDFHTYTHTKWREFLLPVIDIHPSNHEPYSKLFFLFFLCIVLYFNRPNQIASCLLISLLQRITRHLLWDRWFK